MIKMVETLEDRLNENASSIYFTGMYRKKPTLSIIREHLSGVVKELDDLIHEVNRAEAYGLSMKNDFLIKKLSDVKKLLGVE